MEAFISSRLELFYCLFFPFSSSRCSLIESMVFIFSDFSVVLLFEFHVRFYEILFFMHFCLFQEIARNRLMANCRFSCVFEFSFQNGIWANVHCILYLRRILTNGEWEQQKQRNIKNYQPKKGQSPFRVYGVSRKNMHINVPMRCAFIVTLPHAFVPHETWISQICVAISKKKRNRLFVSSISLFHFCKRLF